MESHVLIKFGNDLYDADIVDEFISLKKNKFGYEGLINDRKRAYELFGDEAVYEKCTLDDILLYYVDHQ